MVTCQHWEGGKEVEEVTPFKGNNSEKNPMQLLLKSYWAELDHMTECNCKDSWESWVSELSTLSRALFLRNNEWANAHWESSSSLPTNGVSRNSSELKRVTCKGLFLKDKYGSNKKNKIEGAPG